VVGGYDFVGEQWPDGPLAPDPDPIDYEGHGTHVADIIGGEQGVAPGASLYAIKVCSAVASSCSGAAILQGLEYAVDPNQDGKSDDHVDIVNMSFGSAYDNSYLDDLSTAVQHADRLGVLTVASAGNNGDRPYIVGTPATAPAAFAVAQTQAPGALAYPLSYSSPLGLAGQYKNTTALDWAPMTTNVSGDVVYLGRGCNADTYLANPSGKVALIDRGGCNVSEKVARASKAGALGVLIAMTTPGDPTTFWNGGECPAPAEGACAPSLVITLTDANQIKTILRASTISVSISRDTTIALAGSVVNSSSRGPSSGEMFPGGLLAGQYGQLIKPEIGAPGGSVSARVGSGSGTEPFGGTSGSAPMVSGAAALLLADIWDTSLPPRISELLAVQHCTDKKVRSVKISPREIKARLMNTAETTIYANPTTTSGVLAPITRIGGGELRVDRAMAASASAWEFHGAGGSLSFGMVDVSDNSLKLYRVLEVKNYTKRPITYKIDNAFRYADDQENGAVTVMPARTVITIPPYRSRYLLITLAIDGSKLRSWDLSSGLSGGDTTALNRLEYDGYLTLTDRKNAQNNLHVAWQVLPRLSPNVQITSEGTQASSTPFSLANQGVGAGSYIPLPLLGENTTT
ncbi:MAG: S8 family serine peptidase, partial [Oscillochloris sp.]|nr:S8 family serine peptidase [Oscillochloris sp.]